MGGVREKKRDIEKEKEEEKRVGDFFLGRKLQKEVRRKNFLFTSSVFHPFSSSSFLLAVFLSSFSSSLFLSDRKMEDREMKEREKDFSFS